MRKYDVFIMGDFNIDRIKRENDYRQLSTMFETKGYNQLINEITRYSTQSSCIDLIFTNSNQIFESGTLPVNLSDHEMIYVTRKKVKIKNRKVLGQII